MDSGWTATSNMSWRWRAGGGGRFTAFTWSCAGIMVPARARNSVHALPGSHVCSSPLMSLHVYGLPLKADADSVRAGCRVQSDASEQRRWWWWRRGRRASSEMGQSAVEAAAEAFAGAAGGNGNSVFAAGKVKIWACVLLMLHHWICADKSTSTAGTAASGLGTTGRVKQVRRRRTARLSSASSPRRVDGAGAAQRRVA